MIKNLLNIVYFPLNFLNYLIFKLNNVESNTIKINGIIFLHNQGEFICKGSAKINSSRFYNIIGGDTRSSIIIKNNARLLIGENFKMSNSAIHCNTNITIGNNVMVGGGCKIWDSDFHPLNYIERKNNVKTAIKKSSIIIGNNVFIGGGSIILKGVTIGGGSIIGAGSVVAKDIPENQIWAGNPARYIKDV